MTKTTIHFLLLFIIVSISFHTTALAQVSQEQDNVEISDEDMALFESILEEENQKIDENIYYEWLSTEAMLKSAADKLECHVNPDKTVCNGWELRGKKLTEFRMLLDEIIDIYNVEKELMVLPSKKEKRRGLLKKEIDVMISAIDGFTRDKPESLK